MNANELADELDIQVSMGGIKFYAEAAAMLRQQQAAIDKYKQVLESIANEYVELSHDKIKWQCEDHVKWAKEALK